MDVMLSQITSNTKKREVEQQYLGVAKVNKHQPSHKRKNNMNEGIKSNKEPQIEQFGDVDFNDDSAPQRNDLRGLDWISEISNEHYNAGLISAICEHWQPETNTFHFSWGEMTLSLDDVQHLIGLSADGDVPITEGNSLSLVKCVNFYAEKFKKYNDTIQNEMPAGQKKKAMSTLSVARTASRTGGKLFATYSTLLEVVWDPYRTERRSDHDFRENTFFNGLTSSPDHVDPIYPNRVVRQFARIQPILKNPKCVEVSGLRTWDGEELVMIPKEEAVPSRNLQKNIDELITKYEDSVKRLKEKESFEAWHKAMKKEFQSGELTEKDDPTFIELFDQYDRFYTIAQQGPKGDYQEDFTVTGGNQEKLVEVRRENVVLKKKINETLFQLYVKYHLDVCGVQGEDGNSSFRVPATNKHQRQSQFKKVMNSLMSLMTKDPAFWKSVFSQSLDTRFSSRGEMVYEQLCRACSYGGQHVKYMQWDICLLHVMRRLRSLSAIMRHTHSYLSFGFGKTTTYRMTKDMKTWLGILLSFGGLNWVQTTNMLDCLRGTEHQCL
ncbi:hypothetical protein GIB67_034868 [Kingdonia uniflora]|uniref:Aminotransferase-like plant mobile domain-containing protein n=1 Tax=Kingdonia uniflora TaxID=39325 RepID=A0A7J7ME31_9MAGN|nr:hypothetical protein GIB67_034868 [Kingdonia uniflora]